MTDLLLAIDQGTTGSTCLVLDRDRKVLGTANVPFPQHFPEPGQVEHDFDEIWSSVTEAIRRALATAAGFLRTEPDEVARRIAAIGITNQRETVGFVDRTSGRVVGRLIVWQDRRTQGMCARLRREGHERTVRKRTGLLLDPYFSGTKIAWMLEHVDGLRTRAERGEVLACTVDALLVHRLSGGQDVATDPSNASRTLLWPLEGGGWDAEMCELLGVPSACLPPVRPSNACFGTTRAVPGLPDGIPIHGILGDQQAALFGQGCFAPKTAKCTYGTGAFVMVNTGDRTVPSKARLLTTVAWQIGDATTYALEGSAFMAGAVVAWLRDNLGIIERAADVEPLAREVSDADGVVFVPAHAGLGAPHWRPDARAVICGISRRTTKAHIARAALDGIALQIADLMDAMAVDVGEPVTLLRVDGGAAANDLLMQIQADLLGIRLERPTMLESTAFGAASIAGLGVGLFAGLDDLAPRSDETTIFERKAPPEHVDALRVAYARAVSCA
ncbi:MAG: glycerol kinase [Deltaproteobacteria bacterium]|nr:MAG: glycerol kinase [Deltaproteobacteria bacterium]